MASGPPCHPPPPLCSHPAGQQKKFLLQREIGTDSPGMGSLSPPHWGLFKDCGTEGCGGWARQGWARVGFGDLSSLFPTPIPSTELPHRNHTPHPCLSFPYGWGWGGSHLRLAIRLLLRPIPRHFSRWGAKREAAMLRLQLGQTHSLFFHWLYTCPKMSTPGWSTISVGQEGWRGGWGGREISPALRLTPEICPCRLPPPFPPHQSPSCCRGRCHPGRSSRI